MQQAIDEIILVKVSSKGNNELGTPVQASMWHVILYQIVHFSLLGYLVVVASDSSFHPLLKLVLLDLNQEVA